MSPEIIRAKVMHLQHVLSDLKPHIQSSRTNQEQAHYEIERQVQLAVDLCLAIGRRVLILREIPAPLTSREVFLTLGQKKIISRSLAKRLADAVGLRNIIVHEYDVLDYGLFFGGLAQGYKAFVDFSAKVARVGKIGGEGR